jgi:DNA-binding transcriptional regulator GbsR (MarR family)
MSTKVEVPKEILEKAVNLRNAVRTIYLALYTVGKPITADDIAKLVGHARAYVNMRLNQLEDMGLVKSKHDGKVKLYEVVLSI